MLLQLHMLSSGLFKNTGCGRSVGLSWKENNTPNLTTSITWESLQTFSQRSTNWKSLPPTGTSGWGRGIWTSGVTCGQGDGWGLVCRVLVKYVVLSKNLSLGRCFLIIGGLKYCCEDPLLGGSRVRCKVLGLWGTCHGNPSFPSVVTVTSHCCCCPCGMSCSCWQSTLGIGTGPGTT